MTKKKRSVVVLEGTEKTSKTSAVDVAQLMLERQWLGTEWAKARRELKEASERESTLRKELLASRKDVADLSQRIKRVMEMGTDDFESVLSRSPAGRSFLNRLQLAEEELVRKESEIHRMRVQTSAKLSKVPSRTRTSST